MRYCDFRHGRARARARRLWRADIIAALQIIMEAEGVENEWAQERVRRLLGAVMQQPEQKSMTVTMGGVRLTVSGPGMAVLIAPEVGVDQPESRGRGGT